MTEHSAASVLIDAQKNAVALCSCGWIAHRPRHAYLYEQDGLGSVAQELRAHIAACHSAEPEPRKPARPTGPFIPPPKKDSGLSAPSAVQVSGVCDVCRDGEHDRCPWKGTPAREAHCECSCLSAVGPGVAGPQNHHLDWKPATPGPPAEDDAASEPDRGEFSVEECLTYGGHHFQNGRCRECDTVEVNEAYVVEAKTDKTSTEPLAKDSAPNLMEPDSKQRFKNLSEGDVPADDVLPVIRERLSIARGNDAEEGLTAWRPEGLRTLIRGLASDVEYLIARLEECSAPSAPSESWLPLALSAGAHLGSHSACICDTCKAARADLNEIASGVSQGVAE